MITDYLNQTTLPVRFVGWCDLVFGIAIGRGSGIEFHCVVVQPPNLQVTYVATEVGLHNDISHALRIVIVFDIEVDTLPLTLRVYC